MPIDWLNEFPGRVERDVPLGPMTWFQLGGRARYLGRPASEDDLARMIGRARERGVPTHVLGGGANVLIRDDGVTGLVIRLDDPVFRKIEYDGERVTAGGGVDLMQLSRDCARRGLSGLECMAGIPGTVGGAVRMNAGGRFGSFSDTVAAVRLLSPDGAIHSLPAAELGFSYRRSDVGDRIVLSAELQLRRDDPERVMARFHEIWAWKKGTQPLAEHSAGCVFKNPPGDSAGRLIDQAGMKGQTVGAASVSRDHANFIVTGEGATADHVLRLIHHIREQVRRTQGVNLELEIDIW